MRSYRLFLKIDGLRLNLKLSFGPLTENFFVNSFLAELLSLELLLQVIGISCLIDECAFQELVGRHGGFHNPWLAFDAEVFGAKDALIPPILLLSLHDFLHWNGRESLLPGALLAANFFIE